MYSEAFEVEPLHEHCRVDVAREFENILAQAGGDHLGAYSQKLRDATTDEKQAIIELFERMGGPILMAASRRLNRNYEHTLECSRAVVQVALIGILALRLPKTHK